MRLRHWGSVLFRDLSLSNFVLPGGAVLSVIDQGIVSLSNFTSGVIAARSLSPSQFGAFSIFYATLLVLSGIQTALITSPVRVLGVQKHAVLTSDYMGAQIWLQFALGGIISLTSCIAVMGFSSFSKGLGLSFSLCVFWVQFQEFVRATLATKLSITSLLWLDTLTHGSRFLLLLLFMVTETLTITTLFLALAIPCCIAAILFLPPRHDLKINFAEMIGAARENWRFGRWVLIETLAYTISAQAYFYLTALLISTESAGALNAALSILNLLNVILSGVMSFAVPVARQRLLEIGYQAWKSWLFRVGFSLVTCAFILWILLFVAAKPILAFTYNDFYSRFAYLIQIIGFSYIFRAINTVLISAFRTGGIPHVGSTAQSVSATISLLIGYPLITVYGVAGAALGLVVTHTTWTFVYLWYIKSGELSELSITSRIRQA